MRTRRTGRSVLARGGTACYEIAYLIIKYAFILLRTRHSEDAIREAVCAAADELATWELCHDCPVDIPCCRKRLLRLAAAGEDINGQEAILGVAVAGDV